MDSSYIYNEKPLTIAIANAIRIWGGSENRLVVMATSLSQAGHRVVFYHRNHEIERRLRGTSVTSVRLPFFYDVEPITWIRLVWSMIRLKPHMLIFSDDRAMRLAGHAARTTGVPLRVHVKGHLHFKMTPRTRYVYGMMTTHVMAVTQAVKKLVEDAGVIDPNRIGVIYFPFDPARFLECKTRDLRKELDLPDSVTLFGNVARLSGMKGQKHFIEAAKTVTEQERDVRFVIAGAGRLETELNQQIKDLGLKNFVALLGHRDDIPDVMNSLDVMVLSSIFGEALGGATLEAMAAERPVIVTRVGGLPELVEQQKSGLIVPPGDSHALARAMLELHRDPAMRERMGKRGREIIHERFTPERFWEAWNPLLRQAAESA